MTKTKNILISHFYCFINKMHSQWNQNIQKTKILYRFELDLDQIKLNIPFGCKVFIEWGRKNLKVKS